MGGHMSYLATILTKTLTSLITYIFFLSSMGYYMFHQIGPVAETFSTLITVHE